MQVNYFDIPVSTEAQKVVLPWPLQFVAQKFRGTVLRIYYVIMPGATEQTGTFWLINSEQVLPDTFPGKFIATIFCDDNTIEDDAFHLFFELPANRPARPHVIDAIEPGGDNGA